MPPQTLAERIASAAQAKAAALAARPAATQKAKNAANPKPTRAPAKAIAKPLKPAAAPEAPKTGRKGRGNLSPRNISTALRATIRAVELTDGQIAGLTIALRAMTTRPGALTQLEPDVLDALAATIAGSKVPGPAGHGDRMTLFKLVGIPLYSGSVGGGGKAELAQGMRNLTTALERAHQRVGSASGRVPVIVDAEVVDEGPSNGAFEGYPQKMGDLVRMPDALPIGAASEHQAPGGQDEGGATSPTEKSPAWSLPDFLRGG